MQRITHTLAASLLLISMVAACTVSLEPDNNASGDLGASDAVVAGDADGAGADAVHDQRLEGTPARLIDLVLVVDESGSMTDNLAVVASGLQATLPEATARGWSVRVGVCGATSTGQGRLCSQAAAGGGADRFLDAASELAAVIACVKNPPGTAANQEYLLDNATAAVSTHLPRQSGRGDRIRPGAELQVLVISDEMDSGLSGALPMGSGQVCTLDAASRATLDKAIQGARDLFTGKSTTGARATVHSLGGICGNSCSAEIAHGVRELAAATKGQEVDICLKDLRPALRKILKL